MSELITLDMDTLSIQYLCKKRQASCESYQHGRAYIVYHT